MRFEEIRKLHNKLLINRSGLKDWWEVKTKNIYKPKRETNKGTNEVKLKCKYKRKHGTTNKAVNK